MSREEKGIQRKTKRDKEVKLIRMKTVLVPLYNCYLLKSILPHRTPRRDWNFITGSGGD